MRRPAFTIAALAAGTALTLGGSAGARSQATQIRVSATLTAAQEVPPPSGDVSGARGTFTATVTKSSSGAVIAWKLTFRGLTGPAAAAHVHIAPPGTAGPVAVALCGPCTSGATGTGNAGADVLAALNAGRTYVNIHTGTNPAGEIRGRIGAVASVRTALVPGQERPRPKGNVRAARGLFTGTVTKTGSTAVLRWRLTFRRLTGKAQAAHIHIAPRGKAGPVAVTLCRPCKSGVRKQTKLGAKVLKALEAGRAYVNVHTARNKAGEIRGQLPKVALTIDAAAAPPPGGDCDYPPCP